MSLIKFDDVFFRYRENLPYILNGVSFEVQEGDILGLMGRNGVGKTTLTRLISGVYAPDSGSIWTKYPPVLFSVGVGFKPELTGRKNIIISGVILGFSKKTILQKMDDIVAFSELNEYIDRPVKTYSSGMKARLAFSIGVFLEPDILILDEVLATGDREFKAKAQDKMGELINKSKAVVIVTHSNSMASTLCNRIITIENGKIKD